jgi:post-segregation antitoxin (ccd killing protein)
MRLRHTFGMANKPDERLIFLLPPELLEEVRRAAEEADLSVSQIVRRALRNELKAIAGAKTKKWTAEEVREAIASSGDQIPLSLLLNPTAYQAMITLLAADAPPGKLSDLVGEPEGDKHKIRTSRAAAMRTAERPKK